jgi:hypothetical protein
MPVGHQLPDSLTTAEDGEADVDGLEIEKAYVEVRLQLFFALQQRLGSWWLHNGFCTWCTRSLH